MRKESRYFIGFVVLLYCLMNSTMFLFAQAPTPEPPNVTAAPTAPSDVVADQPAIPTTNVPSPASPEHANDQVMWALGASFLLRWLKNTKWFPWFTAETARSAQVVWGFLLAVVTAVGVNVAVDGSVFTSGGATVTFSGISWAAFKDIAWQWISQQGWYELIVKRSGLPAPAARV